jgi:hypothetical protein
VNNSDPSGPSYAAIRNLAGQGHQRPSVIATYPTGSWLAAFNTRRKSRPEGFIPGGHMALVADSHSD